MLGQGGENWRGDLFVPEDAGSCTLHPTPIQGAQSKDSTHLCLDRSIFQSFFPEREE